MLISIFLSVYMVYNRLRLFIHYLRLSFLWDIVLPNSSIDLLLVNYKFF
jgi:hypothetical protein